jgi:hypothetical protein
MSLTGKSPSETYKDIAYVDNDNNGVTTSLKQVKTGNGSNTALQVSDRSLQVKSATNNTTALDVQNASGTSKLLVDTTNNYVKANGEHVNTQYAHFQHSSDDAALDPNKHYALPFGVSFALSLYNIGTGTDPDTSVTATGSIHKLTSGYWFIMDNITIDRVVWWSAADTATGDTTRCHLMSYDVDSSNGATSGDLSNGVVLADGADITNDGFEQSYYQQMTIQSADVSAGKVVLFTFRSDSINSDYLINATIKYHITG